MQWEGSKIGLAFNEAINTELLTRFLVSRAKQVLVNHERALRLREKRVFVVNNEPVNTER